MKKLLLVVLAWSMLAGESRAEGPPASGEGPGLVTLAVKQTRDVSYRLAGLAIGLQLVQGMSQEQIERVLGCPDDFALAAPCVQHIYSKLKLVVDYREVQSAAGVFYMEVARVHSIP